MITITTSVKKITRTTWLNGTRYDKEQKHHETVEDTTIRLLFIPIFRRRKLIESTI